MWIRPVPRCRIRKMSQLCLGCTQFWQNINMFSTTSNQRAILRSDWFATSASIGWCFELMIDIWPVDDIIEFMALIRFTILGCPLIIRNSFSQVPNKRTALMNGEITMDGHEIGRSLEIIGRLITNGPF